jgi:hypothetical protein
MSILRKFNYAVAVAATLIFGNGAFAQDATATTTNYDSGFRLGFGANVGVPTSNDYQYALGADVRLQYDMTLKTSLTLTTGYTNLFVKGSNNDLGFIPAKAGFKAFVIGDSFYVLGEVGGALAASNAGRATSFLYAPGIGYANKFIDISVRYEDYTDFDTNQVALRLAYGFKI